MKCRRLLKRFLGYACFHLSPFFPVLISAFLDNLNGEFDGSAYNLPFNAVVPFNMDSVSGWYLTWFYQFSVGFAYCVEMITVATYFGCFCYYIIAMCKHFSLLIDSIRLDSRQIHAKKNTRNRHQMWLNARAKLERAIEMHIDIYE